MASPSCDAPAVTVGETITRVSVRDAASGRARMSPRMHAATRAVAETLFTTDAGPPPAERLAWLCTELDHFFSHAGPRSMRMYRLCLLAVSALAPVLVGRLPPFRGLPPAVRTRALERMERSPVALAVFGIKAILCIVYYEHPEAARAAGYDGGCLGGGG